MKEGTFLRRMHPVLTPKLYFRILMIFYTALSTKTIETIACCLERIDVVPSIGAGPSRKSRFFSRSISQK